MTDATVTGGSEPHRKSSLLATDDRTQRRNAAEKRFKYYGMIAVGIALIALVFLGQWVLSLFSPAYAKYLMPLLILSTTPLIMALFGPIVLFVTIRGLQDAARRVFGAALVLLFALILGLGHLYGVNGIAASVVLVWLFWHAWLHVTIRRESGYSTVRLTPG